MPPTTDGFARHHTWPVWLVFLDLILMRGFLAIALRASIDPASKPQEAPHLLRADVAFLSQVNSAGPICDHGRVGGWTAKVDQASNKVNRGLISDAQSGTTMKPSRS